MQVTLYSVFFVFIAIHFCFFYALIKKRNDIADVFWGPGFTVASSGGLFALWLNDRLSLIEWRELIIVLLVAAWGFRLLYHIGRRFIHKAGEDIRYLNWRKEWGSSWLWRSYLQVFLLQGAFLLIISGPVIYSLNIAGRDLDSLATIGVAIWLFGFIVESISDKQLENFKKDPTNKGKLMTTGLWSWSRHPNYFGEVVQWWGIYLLAFNLSDLSSSLLLVLSPVTITFLILKVSGVPMLEELMQGRPGFEDYKKRTSIFILWPPRQ